MIVRVFVGLSDEIKIINKMKNTNLSIIKINYIHKTQFDYKVKKFCYFIV